MTLSDISIDRPVFTAMVSIGIAVLGLLGLSRLGVSLFPDVEYPVVTVTTVYPGASPTEIEREVTAEIEDAVVSLAGVRHVTSYSRDSISFVIVEFTFGSDVVDAATEVRERMAQIRPSLPSEAEDPTVARIDVNATPIMTYVLGGSIPTRNLRDYAEDSLRPTLEQLDGVASVTVLGGDERQINVLLDLDRLQALGLTPLSIVETLRAGNLTVPVGGFDEGDRRISVRTLGEFTAVDEIRSLPVATGSDGSLVRLGDIGSVEDGSAEAETLVRANGAPAIVFEISRTSGANTVAVSDRVRERLATLRLPAGVEASLILDQAEFVRENVHELQLSLWFGGAMAIFVILLFLLDLRSTFISSLALPTSVLGAFFLMYVLGFSLNMMTLIGLSLAIGLLIDDSIVVRENIMKHLERGADPFTAARQGTREITLAVLATTATLCAVFVPIAFTGGMVGQMFREFGFTVAGATLISAYVAFTLDPMLSARLAVQREPGSVHGAVGRFGFVVRPVTRFYETLDALYHALLRWILARRVTMLAVVVLAFGTLFGSCALLPYMGSEFMAPEDRGQLTIDIELPAGTRIEESARLALAAELELVDDPDIVTVYSRIGAAGRPNRVTWRVVAVPKTEREADADDLKARIRELIHRDMPDAEISISDPGLAEGIQPHPFEAFVVGDDLEALSETSDRLAAILRGIPGTRDVDVQFSPGSPELCVHIDRDRLAQLRIPQTLVAATLRASIEGEVAGLYREGDDELDIRVRLREEDRSSAAMIGDVRIATASGFVPITDIATVGRGEGPAEIQRFDRRRTIVVRCSIAGRPLGDVVREFEGRVAATGAVPEGISYVLRGQVEMMNESNENIFLALLLALVFIYLVLASQFESLVHPVTIMMSVLFAFVGAIVALFLQGSSMSMGAMIGMILLMGLVTKNGILLVDHAVARVRKHGWSPRDAILDAGPARLRPILMTSAAMVLGMLPTALSTGPGSEFRAPMSMGVIGGVISSTLLTLLVVPIFYLFMEWLRHASRRFWTRWVLGRPFVEMADGGPAAVHLPPTRPSSAPMADA